MIDFLWFFFIFIIIILSLKLSKNICFENYKLNLNKIDKTGLFMSLGTKIGVGSMIGTSMCILLGGPGTLVWILLFSIITSSFVYCESYLGSKYKIKLDEKIYMSSPYFYIKNGLKKNKLALFVIMILIITYSHLFLMIQTNTILEIININKYVFLVIMFFFLLLTLFLKIKNIINILNKIVPFMCLLFIIVSLFIIFNNYYILKDIIRIILLDAFSKKGLSIGFIIGVKRCIFQSELLVGTTAIASGISNKDNKEVAKTQTLGFYFINFIICTLTTFLILIYLYKCGFYDTSYNQLLINTFSFHMGKIGYIILMILIILFSVTTLLSGYYIGITNIKYLFKNKSSVLFVKFTMLVFSLLGILFNSNLIWFIIDFFLIIIIVINMIIIYLLKDKID